MFAGNAGNRVIVEEPEFLSLVHVAADRLAVKGLLEDHMPVVPGVGIAAGHLEEAAAAGDAEDGSDGDLTGLQLAEGEPGAGLGRVNPVGVAEALAGGLDGGAVFGPVDLDLGGFHRRTLQPLLM